MSLVSTYVPADDGKMYRNPVLSEKDWFICFDDDDPAELVIRTKSGLKPKEIFEKIGMKYSELRKHEDNAERCFGKKLNFEPSISYFFEPTNKLNHKFITSHDGATKKVVHQQGVYYEL